MSRILLAWELGHNLGHLSRLRPIADRLKAQGHVVLVVAKDLAAAARTLAPAGIPFLQAPQAPVPPRGDLHLAGYADLLRHQGWGETGQLFGILHAWVNLMRMFAPHAVVLDHSPTAALAARSLGIPAVWIGTGFEIPPLVAPLPAFPGVPAERAAYAEAMALDVANRVLQAMRLRRLNALADLFAESRRWLATYPELDHYGVRPQGDYIGVFDDLGFGKGMEWAGRDDRRIFAYLRSHTPDCGAILDALSSIAADVVCYAPDIAAGVGAPRAARPGLVFSNEPVRLDGLWNHMDLCVSYAPAGTVATTLLHGIPQLCAPPHMEASLTALRVESMGAGLFLRGPQTASGVEETIRKMFETGDCRVRAGEFARRYDKRDPEAAIDNIAHSVEAIATAGVAA